MLLYDPTVPERCLSRVGRHVAAARTVPCPRAGQTTRGAACRGIRRGAIRPASPPIPRRRRGLWSRCLPPRPWRGAASSRSIPGLRWNRPGRPASPVTRSSGSVSRTERRRCASTAWDRTITGSALGRKSCSTGAGRGSMRWSSRCAPRWQAMPIPMPIAPGRALTAILSWRTSAARFPNWGFTFPRMRSVRISCRTVGCLPRLPADLGFRYRFAGSPAFCSAPARVLRWICWGLSFGIDPVRPALKLPAPGRLGVARL